MDRFVKHLQSEGYKVKGNQAVLGAQKFQICSGTVNTAIGVQKTFWLEKIS
jgi:hypothetical protein